jgi:hypothetical protein
VKDAANGAAASTHLGGYGPDHLNRWQSEESLSQIHVKKRFLVLCLSAVHGDPLEYVNAAVNES